MLLLHIAHNKVTRGHNNVTTAHNNVTTAHNNVTTAHKNVTRSTLQNNVTVLPRIIMLLLHTIICYYRAY